MRRSHAHAVSILLLLACGRTPDREVATATVTQGLTVPGGFTDSRYASGIKDATAMAFAPDGRIFVAEQGGRLRVVKQGALLAASLLEVPADFVGERGLVGVAVDPEFATNGWVYVYYAPRSPAGRNRISRFTAGGDVADAGSEVVLVELDPLSSTIHNGGAIHFGPDGKLYAAVGDNQVGANAQSLDTRHGKILRLERDGSIPADNPFVAEATGPNRAIWALGLRNPFTFAFDPASGRMFVNDVGEGSWEEVDEVVAGANLGWPATEGPTDDPRFRAPIFAYEHGATATTGCAITGGAFYSPAVATFPPDYAGSYFFADFCRGWIRRLDPAGNVSDFASGGEWLVDLKVGPDGALYYLSQTGVVGSIQFAAGNRPPIATITAPPAGSTVAGGDVVHVAGSATDPEDGALPPSAFHWWVDVHEGANVQSFIPMTDGVAEGSFTIPASGAQPAGVFLRIHLAVTDSAGLTVTTFRDVLPRAPLPSVAGGLLGQYFDELPIPRYRGERVDPTVSFDWGGGSPDPALPPDLFGVRWTGKIVPRFSEPYRFHTVADDGVQLWVNGTIVVSDWGDHEVRERSGTIELVAGQAYDIRLEYYENQGLAQVHLLWSSASQPMEVVPASQLFPP